jgi:hypothetical protein
MSENFEEDKDKRIDYRGKSVSVVIQYGYQHYNINGTFLGETGEHFIVKNSKNKVVHINKEKIIYHIFEQN